MSNNVRLQVLLKAVDQASRPFKSIQTASKSLSAQIRDTRQNLKELNAQAGRVEGFRKSSAQLAVTGQALAKAKQEAAALAVQFKNTEKPTRAQAQLMEAAKRSAAELQLKYNGLRQSVQRQRQELAQVGINTRTLAADERRLKSSISETTAQLNRQREALSRVSQQQAKLSAVSQRYQAGKQLAGSVAGAGAAGVGAATVGGFAAKKLLTPGYDFAQKNSELQAVLGVAKDSADMVALRTQARQLGDNTAASADDAAGAQIIIAKAGGDKDAITAATPVTLNMALANRKTMEENATLLMGVKSAFGMANDQVAHIGDVISQTMNKSAANFEGLSDTLTYAAPVAKNAGISVEETAAIAGALADAKITGSMAGTGSRAVITRLQAPMGKANDALGELGVKTADRKGNMRPLFTILKEMQRSFDKNKLGTAQRAEYMKVIFGEEASSAAAVLMGDAASGKLDRLTKLLRESDGKTEELVKVMQDNLGGDLKELQSAYEAIGIDMYDQLETPFRELTTRATKFLLKIDLWIKNNKELAGTLAKVAFGGLAIVGTLGAIGLASWPVIMGINGIIAVAGALGTAFSVAGGAIMAVLGALTWPIVAVGAAIVAGALLIRKYWKPISAFFSGVIEGLISAFAPVGELFRPLKPVFDWLGEKLKAVWQWFKDLIEPVKSTKETLDNCKNAGLAFGRGLADVLMLPLRAFNKLRQGIDWVLEKLGVINAESSDLDKKAQKANDYANGANGRGYSPSGGLLTGGYVPVTAGGGKSYVDNSVNNFHVGSQHPGGASAAETKRMLLDVVEERERKRRAAQRSNMVMD
ncbi:phage tail tape measure protein [Serratia marcescens]|uniref:phage tail tape measure protein n=1 Tax=Serratia marcescens TaxID=615 RepID=UPI0007455420|nr:phage tail tape measure protein [Serratia marcescens]MBI6174376.1 phage tail tape measure protein [Serratia marcescens]CUY10191.1 Phage-related minor tail protein [Serratia marcescens]CUY36260.1 Phage-related minor tail protein [Serratia marcescens]CUY38713.1 Phage-related minor tail protein [Serratia marcescens]CUY40473.1 Phage-related minor tail protein [Serratia marcescens]